MLRFPLSPLVYTLVQIKKLLNWGFKVQMLVTGVRTSGQGSFLSPIWKRSNERWDVG